MTATKRSSGAGRRGCPGGRPAAADCRHGPGGGRGACRRSGVLLAALCWWVAGGGSLGAAGVGEGLAAYRDGDFAAAAEVYGAAAEERPDEPSLLYNAGISAYRQGDYAAAHSRLQQAVNHASRPELTAAGHLALGNTRLLEAEQLLQQDPGAAPAAMRSLESGIASFERALQVTPDYAAAAHNLELARVRLDALRRQQPPPQQQQSGSEAGGQEQEQQEQGAPGEQDGAPEDSGAGDEASAPPAGAPEEPPEPPAEGASQDPAEAPSEQDPELLARQIIAAEEAAAEQRRNRRSRQQPVARNW